MATASNPGDQFFVQGYRNDPGPFRKVNRHQGDKFGVGHILLSDLSDGGRGRNRYVGLQQVLNNFGNHNLDVSDAV